MEIYGYHVYMYYISKNRLKILICTKQAEYKICLTNYANYDTVSIPN